MHITVHLPKETSIVLEVESSNTINEVIAMTGLEPATHSLRSLLYPSHIFENTTWSLKKYFISEGSDLEITTKQYLVFQKAIDDEAEAWDSIIHLNTSKQSLTYQLQGEEKKVVKSTDYEWLCNAIRDVTNALNSAEKRYAETSNLIEELRSKL